MCIRGTDAINLVVLSLHTFSVINKTIKKFVLSLTSIIRAECLYIIICLSVYYGGRDCKNYGFPETK